MTEVYKILRIVDKVELLFISSYSTRTSGALLENRSV